MKDGDFVNIDYVARVKSSGEIFDFTTEEAAKELGSKEAGPVTIVLGAGHVIPGLDEEIRKHKAGDEFEVDISAEMAFGRRSPKLMQLIPINKFRKDKIDPLPGMRITVNNMMGIVRSASGGRVIVDFNHPLAGKELHYWVRINKLVTAKAERIKSLLEYHGLKNFTLKTTKAGIVITSTSISEAKKAFVTKELQKYAKVKDVKFETKKQPESGKKGLESAEKQTKSK